MYEGVCVVDVAGSDERGTNFADPLLPEHAAARARSNAATAPSTGN
jgi:hypothetical protein